MFARCRLILESKLNKNHHIYVLHVTEDYVCIIAVVFELFLIIIYL